MRTGLSHGVTPLDLSLPQLFDDVLERFNNLRPVHFPLLETHPEIEVLRGRTECEDERTRAPRRRLGRFLANLLPRGVALCGQALDQGGGARPTRGLAPVEAVRVVGGDTAEIDRAVEVLNELTN